MGQTVKIGIAHVLEISHNESSSKTDHGIGDGHVVIPVGSPGPHHKVLVKVEWPGEFRQDRAKKGGFVHGDDIVSSLSQSLVHSVFVEACRLIQKVSKGASNRDDSW